MTQPIAGNQYFKNVENVAGQVGLLNASQAKVAGNVEVGGNVRADELAAGLVSSVPSDKTLVSVTLSTPTQTTWYGQATDAQALVNKGTTTAFTFPKAATVVASRLTVTTGFTSGGAATIQVGVSATAAGASGTLIDGGAVVGSAVGSTVSVSNGAGNSLASAGATSGAAAAQNNFVTVNAKTADLTAGAADVVVWYYEN